MLLMDNLNLLLEISEKAGLFGSSIITTSGLSKKFGVSQQGISNALIRLERQGMITRVPSNSGITVALSGKGRKLLETFSMRLTEVLKKKVSVTGKVVAGVGQGKYYTEVPGFKRQFKKKLRIDTYPGTLNLKVRPVDKKAFLHGRKAIVIDGFKTEKREFGWIRCYPVFVDSIRCAVTVPERTLHKDDIIELISGLNLRQKLGLRDGSKVVIEWS